MDGRASRTRCYVETALAAMSGLLGVVTFFWHDWLEAFGFDPDQGNGSVEWAIVVVLLAAAVALGLSARSDWRRLAAARS
jgi:hypothetical protein